MVRTLNCFEEGEESRGVERAGDLTGAATDFVLYIAVHIGGSREKAGFCGPGADDLVIRKQIAGIENGAVNLGACQLYIVNAVISGIPVIGGAASQQIAEERVAQLLSGDRGPGDLHGNGNLFGRSGICPEL